jgi:hypothetical protein
VVSLFEPNVHSFDFVRIDGEIFFLLFLSFHFSTSKMTLHFIQLKLDKKTYKAQVSTDGCSYVDDLRTAIKNKFSPELDSYAPHHLHLFQPDGITEIDPETLVTDLEEIPWKPMVVTVDELPIPAPSGSSKKQLTYKGLGVEASCRKYFDALARKLALYYRFKWTHGKYPTMGDVLYAYQKRAWKYQYEYQTEEERTDEPGFTQVDEQVPILSIRLPDLFDTDEWAKLKEWNQKTNSRIHDADLPKTSTGKYFVIIPHADYNDKTISFFKTIGVKGHLYDNESKLEVKDEDDLSGSSSSESGSPDKEKKM